MGQARLPFVATGWSGHGASEELNLALSGHLHLNTLSLHCNFTALHQHTNAKMSNQGPPYYGMPPSDKDTPSQDRGIFHHEAQKHESHHYLRMYGGQVMSAATVSYTHLTLPTKRIV